MNNVKVTWDEVVRHFLRTQSHKPELKGINIGDLSLTSAEQLMDRNYAEIARRMRQCKQWHFRSVDEEMFEGLRALSTSTWSDLSEGSLKISDIAKNVMKKEGYACTRQKVQDLVKLAMSERFDSRIVVQFNGEDGTVLDGTCRAVAMVQHFSQHGFSRFLAYVGSTMGEE